MSGAPAQPPRGEERKGTEQSSTGPTTSSSSSSSSSSTSNRTSSKQKISPPRVQAGGSTASAGGGGPAAGLLASQLQQDGNPTTRSSSGAPRSPASASTSATAPAIGITTSASSHSLGRAPGGSTSPPASGAGWSADELSGDLLALRGSPHRDGPLSSQSPASQSRSSPTDRSGTLYRARSQLLSSTTAAAAAAAAAGTTTGAGGSPRQALNRTGDSPESLRSLVAASGAGGVSAIPPSSFRTPSAQGIESYRRTGGQRPRHAPSTAAAARRLQRASSISGIFDLDEGPAITTGAASTSSSSPSSAAAAAAAATSGPIPVGQRRIPSPFSDGFHETGSTSASASASALSPSSLASAASSALSSSPEGSGASPEPVRRISPRGSLTGAAATTTTTAASGVPSSGAASLALPLPSSGLSVPQPMGSSSAVSPISGKARGVFDTAPSFSSPLAYASVLPQEQAEELDLDLEGGLETQSIRETSDEEQGGEKGKPREHVKRQQPQQQQQQQSRSLGGSAFIDRERSSSVSSSATTASSRPELSPPLIQQQQQQQQRRSHATTPASPDVASAHGSQDGHAANVTAAESPAAPSNSGKLKRRSSAIGSMGPPLPSSRKTSGESSSSAAAAAAMSIGGGGEHPPSRKARGSGASDLAVQLGVVPAWSETSSAGTSPEQQHQVPPPPSQASSGGVPLSRRRSSTAHNSSSTRHRRAKSLGGMLLGVEPGGAAGSPVGVGGPEGVDPNLVAAIRAGDSSIPGTPAPQPEGSSLSGSGGGMLGNSLVATHLGHLMSTSPRIASMPSTPSGSVRLGPQRRVDLLNVMPDTRALANTYPSMQIQVPRKRSESGSGASLSPQESVAGSTGSGARLSPTTPHAPLPMPRGIPASPRSSTSAMPILAPEGYVRSRVRSQTLAVSTAAPSAGLSTSVGAGANRHGGAPLGEAIRLQRVPSSVRLAGDLYVPSSPVLSRADHRLSMSVASAHSSSAASDPAGAARPQGLGIGVDHNPASDSSLQLPPPQTPSGSRASSPAAAVAASTTRMANSSSTSGFSSPSRRLPSGEASRQALLPADTTSSMHSSFVSDAISSSPVTRSQHLSPTGRSYDAGSAFAPLLSMPSSPAQTRRANSMARPGLRSFFDAPDLGSPFDHPERPAPWIASSQDDRFAVPRPPGGSIAMERPSSSNGRPRDMGGLGMLGGSPMPAPQHRRSFVGPISPAAGEGGSAGMGSTASRTIDEYARIIVQSRNAKMYKWRSLGKPSSSQSLQPTSSRLRAPPTSSAGPSTPLMRPGMDEKAMSYGSDDSAWGYLSADVGGAASPPASPSGLAAGGEDQASTYSTNTDQRDVGAKEIEWVDWLDEYRKMKEAKLRAEQEAEGSGSPSLSQGEAERMQPIQQSPSSDSTRGRSSPVGTSALATPSTAEQLSSELSALSIGPGSRPRRPSEQPRHAAADARHVTSVTPSSSSLLLTAGTSSSHGGGSSSTGTNPRRASMFSSDSRRNLSLSPITSRVAGASASAAAQGSPASSSSAAAAAAASASRKRRHLGGKIDAWWGAVKSGFAGAMMATPSTAPAASTGFEDRSRRLHHLGGAFGAGHLRAHTNQPRAERSAEADKSLHSLRSTSSAQNLKASRGDAQAASTSRSVSTGRKVDPARDATGSAARSSSPASRSSDTTAAAAAAAGETSASAQALPTSSKKRQPPLALNLEKGFSSFDAPPFEGMSGASTATSANSGARRQSPLSLSSSSPRGGPPSASLPDSASPRNTAFSRSLSRATAERSAPSPSSLSRPLPHLRSGSPSPRGTRHISDTWRHVESEASVGAPAMSRQASPERERRGSGTTTAAAAAAGGGSSTGKGKEMDTIQRHIRHRLAASKESCDRELRRIVVAINTFVEEQMMAKMNETLDSAGADVDDDVDVLEGSLSALQLERHDARETLASTTPAPVSSPEGGMSRDSSAASGLNAQEQPSEFDPDETPRPADSPLEAPTPRRPSRAADYRLPAPPPRVGGGAAPLPIARALTQQAMTRARSRDAASSMANSRSTSRSHSPMPLSAAEGSPQFSPARRLRSLLPEEAPLEPWITALQDIALLAMEVMDASIYSLASRGGACQEIIANVQTVGQAWDENPEWPGRGWYVRLLLAVAGLSRVVEWWEAERGFWNFEDEDALQSADSVRFIMGGPADAGAAVEQRSTSGTNSPSRMRRGPAQAPSVQSSAQSSPALDPWDRRVVSEGGDPMRRGGGAEPSSDSPLAVPTSAAMAATASTPGDGSSVVATPLEPVGEASSASSSTDEPGASTSTGGEALNVLMELSLDGESFSYLSPAWQKVVGTEPSAVLDRPITDLLAPGDASKFHEATEKLRDNDSHTVEIAFRLEVDPSVIDDEARQSLPDGAVLYQEMEGKGMLMHDRQSGSASHTMWVFKPIGEPELAAEIESGVEQPLALQRDAIVAPKIAISTEPILCRICERDIPTWFFEKHSEICHEIHRLEMEIGEINETLAELRRVVKDLLEALEDGEASEASAAATAAAATPQYRGIALTTPAASNAPPSALEVATRSISPRQPNAAALRKQHLRALDGMLDALRTAMSISTPAVKEDTAEQPVEKQRLLSPESESKLTQARAWRRPQVEDAAIEMLAVDVEAAVRSKLVVVNRTLNTIVYVETVRQEWEARVEAALGRNLSGSGSGSASGSGTGSGGESDGSMASSNASREDLLEEAPDSSSPHARQATTPPTLPAPPPPQPAAPQLTRQASPRRVLSPTEAEEAEVSAILLERDERELPPSGPLVADKSGQAADEDDIPAVDSRMGGSAAEPSPIPIPRGVHGAQVAHPRRSDNVSPGPNSALALPGASQPMESLMPLTLKRSPLLPASVSVGRTPPMSPHLSPSAPVAGSKSRRISVTHRSIAGGSGAPLSPRIPPSAPSSRPTASTIKDFDVIKPISKGAFGSVFLAKKRTTGDYYAIKVLRKADMIAKNQITNVKAERMILMTQTSIPFVVKLFFTFQSAEYLYFVMEYLPGGDCASLCKALGGLSEAWARQYVAEIVVGLEQVHAKGVVHRDMKPDNLLIDQRGHLKLTDFGLSKYGLLGRQTRQQATGRFDAAQKPKGDSPAATTSPSSVPISRSASQQLSASLRDSLYATSPTAGIVQGQTFFTGSQRARIVSSASDSSGSGAESVVGLPATAGRPAPVPATMLLDSPGNVFGSHVLSEAFSHGGPPTSESSSSLKKIVGTPDYLAPESVLGIGMDDMAVDWWAVGVILYEFLYGYPPFHAETPEKVFDNILSRRIDWEEETMDISPEARDLMERLMCTDQRQRLGTQGAAEIKAHPFFAGIDWERVTEGEGPFIPQVTDPESTDYFDLRGATHQEFSSEAAQNTREFAKAIAVGGSALEPGRPSDPGRPPSRLQSRLDRQRSEAPADDFGSFSYKNLPVLKQANDEVVRKMRGDQMQPLSQTLEHPPSAAPPSHVRHRSLSGKHGRFGPRTQALHGVGGGPPSPSTSVSSQSSLPSRSTAPPSPAALPPLGAHKRRPSELSSVAGPLGLPPASSMERRRSQLAEQDGGYRRTSLPTRLRTASLGGEERPSLPGNWKEARAKALRGNMDAPGGLAAVEDDGGDGDGDDDGGEATTSAASATAASAAAAAAAALSPISPAAVGGASSSARMRILIAEDNPISLRMLEAVLTKLGCQCVTVRNGAEAVRLAMADVKFAAIFCDTSLPIVDGSDVARMIKATRNANASTPIVALTTSESGQAPDVSGTVFDAALLKPVERGEVCNVMASLGFKTLVGGASASSANASKRSFGNGGSGSKGSSEPSSSVSAAAGGSTPAHASTPTPQLKQTRTAEEALAASVGGASQSQG